MNDSISRQAVEEAAASAEAGLTFSLDYKAWPDFHALYRAAQAILDGEPLDWCVVHGAVQRPETVECWIGYDITIGNADDLCRFESRVLVRVGE